MNKLSKEEIIKELETLEGWSLQGEHIQKTFQFKGFLKTMSFVNALAWEANRHIHHPDLQVSFNKCIVNITTHDADGITEKDFALARAIEALL